MISRVPEDFHTITPQLVVKGVAAAIAWYTQALGANELLRHAAPDGTSIMHSELLLGDSRFFVVDEFPGSMTSPAASGGTPVTLHLYVHDVDARVQPRCRGRRGNFDAGGRSILGRQVRHDPRSLRAPLVDRESTRGPIAAATQSPGRQLGKGASVMTTKRFVATCAVVFLLADAEQPWPGSLVIKQLALELFSTLALGVVVAGIARRSITVEDTRAGVSSAAVHPL